MRRFVSSAVSSFLLLAVHVIYRLHYFFVSRDAFFLVFHILMAWALIILVLLALLVFSRLFFSVAYRGNCPPFEYGEHRASLAISSLGLIAGSLPPRALALVVEWASIHRAELKLAWEQAAALRTPDPIPLLE